MTRRPNKSANYIGRPHDSQGAALLQIGEVHSVYLHDALAVVHYAGAGHNPGPVAEVYGTGWYLQGLRVAFRYSDLYAAAPRYDLRNVVSQSENTDK